MARLLDFDPDKWGREGDGSGGSTPAKVANPAKPEPTLAALATLAGLDAALFAGLERLQVMSPPKRCDPAAWLQSVGDALRLALEGWASQALALGWAPLDLFGAVADPDGDPSLNGRCQAGGSTCAGGPFRLRRRRK